MKLKHSKRFTITCTYLWMCIILSILTLSRYARTQECGSGCCLGFVWNQRLNSCIPCNPGYHGPNCSSVCVHPYFGKGCRQICNCSQNDCNHEYGCKMLPEDCDVGFIGLYCELPCRYPAYGYLCQKSCNCEEKFCNVSTGCEVGSPTIEQPSPSPSEETTLALLSFVSVSKTDKSCPLGYTGSDCETPCRYPSYGYSCQEYCNCSVELCNITVGCIDSDCEPGYTGPKCRIPCHYPTYGYLCQQSCSCEERLCNITVGCENASDDSRHLCQNDNSSQYRIKQEKMILLIFGIIFQMTSAALMLAANVFINNKRPRSKLMNR